MDIQCEEFDQVLLASVQGDRLDAAAALGFKEAMRQRLARGEGRVILDLSQVAFLDSSGLGAVVAVRKFLKPGQRLELVGLTPAVRRVFALTRMDEVFPIYPALLDALAQGEG